MQGTSFVERWRTALAGVRLGILLLLLFHNLLADIIWHNGPCTDIDFYVYSGYVSCSTYADCSEGTHPYVHAWASASGCQVPVTLEASTQPKTTYVSGDAWVSGPGVYYYLWMQCWCSGSCAESGSHGGPC